jgi:hypothetical protein
MTNSKSSIRQGKWTGQKFRKRSVREGGGEEKEKLIFISLVSADVRCQPDHLAQMHVVD